jgi:ribosomal protein S1
MAATIYTGTVTFIHHDKNYVTIEYLQNERIKTINGAVGPKEQLKWKAEKIIKKEHQFRIGDAVNFIIVPTAKKDKLMADCIIYLYNNALTNMLQKASIDNAFVGYLKEVEGKYFVKETASYIVFPLVISPWESTPNAMNINEPIFFTLNNFDKPDKATAALKRHQFIPEYNTANNAFKNKTILQATVSKVTPHTVYVQLISEKIEVKISKENLKKIPEVTDTIPVKISFISPFKIVAIPV